MKQYAILALLLPAFTGSALHLTVTHWQYQPKLGLGLSLAHYIVTKGHGSTLEVKSQLGQGSLFSSILPV